VPAIYGKVVTPPFLRLTQLSCCNGILQGEPSPVGNVDKTSVIHVIHSANIQQQNLFLISMKVGSQTNGASVAPDHLSRATVSRHPQTSAVFTRIWVAIYTRQSTALDWR
jgi:hypothetical protein